MPTEEDIKQKEGESPEEPEDESRPAPSEDDEAAEAVAGKADAKIDDGKAELQASRDDEPAPVAAPSQLGTKRFVYAFYFAGAIAIAFVSSKLIDYAWFRLQSWKPSLGEPKDEYTMPLAAALGAGVALYYWFRTRARTLAEEVASEMAKVTYPSRTEVTNGTFIVIVTTVVSTVFFALMDQFWRFVTKLVYGG